METLDPSHSQTNLALPLEITEILSEVAKTGSCEGLRWVEDDTEQNIATYPKRPEQGGHEAKSHATKLKRSRAMVSSAQIPWTTGTNSWTPATGNALPHLQHQKRALTASRKQASGTDYSLVNKWKKKKRHMSSGTGAKSSAGSSVGRGSTGGASGSERDDSTQYECDSEGTSTTTNSEVSIEKKTGKSLFRLQELKSGALTIDSMRSHDSPSVRCTTLQDAFCVAVRCVLDSFYEERGGYRLSPIEKKQSVHYGYTRAVSGVELARKRQKTFSAREAFLERRGKLVQILKPRSIQQSASTQGRHGPSSTSAPPFTLQRIAEVLLAPDRYYTQTHKLCNCLEKLLLVTSSTESFGGGGGGDTSQSRREERELTALANERGREASQLRIRSQKRSGALVEEGTALTADTIVYAEKGTRAGHGNARERSFDGSKENGWTARETIEAAARASLRTKFDHVGIDPHSSIDRDVRSIAESRTLNNSPPPPSLALSANTTSMTMQTHSSVPNFVRHQLQDQNPENQNIARVPSPILFASSDPEQGSTNSYTNVHLLPIRNPHSVPGVSTSLVDLTTIEATLAANRSANSGPGDIPDAELEHGRSSASNSDVDSESDDVSLDDSASDRSDGSDSGGTGHYEQFTAARAMAISRMQQQQRLQNRVLTGLSSLHQNEFRPPADSEYQSGDSIDSMRAEDSGGSDSSSQSSDIAD